MSEDASSNGSPNKSWLERISQVLSGEPRNQEELLEELRSAQANGLMGLDTLAMIEGAMAVAEKTVGDVMVPSAHVVSISAQAQLADVLKIVVESGHSRFPITGETRDQVLGVLLAKDLLKCFIDKKSKPALADLVRPISLIPDSKKLNVLLKEFRASRHHMAVVVNEFGGLAGLVTIEDVLEEIVGDISDEHDDEDSNALIQTQSEGGFLVSGLTLIKDFNQRFGTRFSDEEYDTIAGLLTSHFGHMPALGEEIALGGLLFRVSKADSRRLLQTVVQIEHAS